MKFSLSFVLAALVASAVANPAGGFGGFGGGNNNANNGNNAANKSGAAANSNNNNGGATSTTNNGNNNANAGTSTSSSAAAAAASSGNNAANDDDSLTLDSSVLATGFEQDGNETPTAGQVASLTSKNNFINFCAGQVITNGLQVKTGSCNPAPMGQIAATTSMPSAKFVNPANGATLAANQTFTVQMAISNLETGNFVNADTNYFAAPQQTNSAGQIVGHSHIVIEQLSSLDQTTTTNPGTFAFFKGLNDAASNGVLTADVTGGLSPGTYRIASINTAANHQPALVAVAQHGSLDDMAYFTVSENGAAAATTGSSTNTTSTATGNANANAGNANAGNANANAGNANANAGNAGKNGNGGKNRGKKIRFAREIHA